MNKSEVTPALLTRTEFEWLSNKVKISKAYEYRIKRDIRKKIKSLTELEIPLLIEKGFIYNIDLSKYTQNLRTNPQTNDHNYAQLSSNIQFQSQNMVGREGFEPSNPAMSRRYLNQARPPAPCIKAAQKFCPTNS